MSAPAPLAREQQLVELVDAAGQATGSTTVAHAHTAPGLPHRAFSVLLLRGGRMLLQRRAEAKTRFPARWANACCGHPGPGEPVVPAALRRLDEELGMTGVRLREVGVYRYRAHDPASDLVEDEHDHVLVGQLPAAAPVPDPDPAEVSALRWVDPAELATMLATDPQLCAPWLAGVVGVLSGGDGPGWAR